MAVTETWQGGPKWVFTGAKRRTSFWEIGRKIVLIAESRNLTPTHDSFQTDTIVPATGIYRVIHAEHRLPHEVVLTGGDKFPRCSKCDVFVVFELVREVRARFEYQPVQIYELPIVDDEEKKADAAEAKG